MQKSSSNFIKGLGAGMIAGATAVIVGKMVMKDNKKIEKGGAKVIKAAGELVDGVQTMFR
ncbi:MAG: hypothetical protein E7542_04700 [Ruminococcaceae bacterium]|nr:hypothetical protein [Oscillospiraceae bacterium]